MPGVWTRMVSFNVQEIIPLTVQGEGLKAGMPCSFIRLFGCPVGCYFCDTGYADGATPKEGFKRLTYSEIWGQLLSENVVISGGEPTVNARFSDLSDNLVADGKRVFVETAGVKWVDGLDDCWVTFSPKEKVSPVKCDPVFWVFADEIKIVISSPDDFSYYLPRIKERQNVLLQPEWGVEKNILPFIIEQSNYYGFRVSIQTHKHLGVR